MDPTKTDEELLEELRTALSRTTDSQYDSNYGAIPPSYAADTITLTGSNGYSWGNLGGYTTATTATTTISGANWANVTLSSPYAYNGLAQEVGTGKLQLNGKEADLVVNGKSLMTTLERIEQRLNMLTPNEKLEGDWDQLRELGEAYRSLEAKLIEQQEMWDKLKSMPPPEMK